MNQGCFNQNIKIFILKKLPGARDKNRKKISG
jgi:hypothetical protein